MSSKRAILLSLGEFGLDRLPETERRSHIPSLLKLYRDDPDPGIHGAAQWLLRQWGAQIEILEIDKALGTGRIQDQRIWYVNRQGQTMVIISGPVEVSMGEVDTRHKRKIGRRFAIASKEVTAEQFYRFRKQPAYLKAHSPPSVDCPIHMVSWYEAAEYCNWLSEQDGIPKDQWCYLPNPSGKYAAGMQTSVNYLHLTGYRLPTDAEWETACRAGAETVLYSFGEAAEVLEKYAWFERNSLSTSHPVGLLKPNDLGLSDMHGNIWEWTQSVDKPLEKGQTGTVHEDLEDASNEVADSDNRVSRGGSFGFPSAGVRFDYRINWPPSAKGNLGVRPARTLPPVPLTALPTTTEGGSKLQP